MNLLFDLTAIQLSTYAEFHNSVLYRDVIFLHYEKLMKIFSKTTEATC